MDLGLLGHCDCLLTDPEVDLVRGAKTHDAQMFYGLRSIPGIGTIFALARLYGIHDIHRFPRVQAFIS